MTYHEVATYTVRIFIAGELAVARQTLRQLCMSGLCVTVAPTTFIYTAGAEDGVEIGLVNYPRFPATPDEIWDKAKAICFKLITDLCQSSALLVAPDRTLWINGRQS